MKQTIHIPTSLRDITLSQYQRFLKIVEGNTDETFIRQKMVQIFCGIGLKYVDNIAKKDFVEITNAISLVLEATPELVTRFDLNHVTYGFIPDLDKITLGEFIDLDNTLGDWEKMQQAMSVLYRPVSESKGGKYLIEPYDGEQNPTFSDMPMDAVISSMLFFWRLSRELLNYTLNSSRKALETEEVQAILPKDLTKNGVGTQHLTLSLEETFQELMKSLNSYLLPPSFIWLT